MRFRTDFSAPAGTHFGVIPTLDDALNAIPGAVDMWDATAESVTLTSGRVSAWTGRLGRQFIQTDPARRPVYDGGFLRMHDPATGAAQGVMALSGTQLGEQTALTIATRVRILQAALDTDLQYLWASSSPIFRIIYRDTNASNHLRANVLSGSSLFDVDLPETQTDIGVVLTCDGSQYEMHVAGGASAVYAGTGPANLSNLFLGSQTGGAGSLIGWQRRFGIWRHVPSAAELAAILKWVA